jgi:hypothetical protein
VFGLNSNHDNPLSANTSADVRMQQATVNLFADMGVQPATLQSGLSPATASADTTPPTSKITSPSPGATIQSSTVTITGTATDAGGGVIGGVEVSVDGGKTWHPDTRPQVIPDLSILNGLREAVHDGPFVDFELIR